MSFCLIVIIIEPTIANNNITEVIINQIKWLVYIIFPMEVISEISTKLLSQLFEETYEICVSCLLTISKLSALLSELGNILLIGIKKERMAIIAKGILLLVSLISSDTLILISININKNKIDTAPT